MQFVQSQRGDAANWHCPTCNNENWPNRRNCNRCGEPRGNVPPGGTQGAMGGRGMGGSAAGALTQPATITPSTFAAGPNGETPLAFLEAISAHNKWRLQLAPFQHVSAESGGVPMFLWKVLIELPAPEPDAPPTRKEYVPQLLYSAQEEARHAAALHTLKEMGVVQVPG
jgi:hypothetical protein|eukprot:COSAG01_NODE_3054_length_6659_cov_11.240396_5_plen_169_part_00